MVICNMLLFEIIINSHIAAECPTRKLCWNCKEYGHMASECTNKTLCHTCNGYSHISYLLPLIDFLACSFFEFWLLVCLLEAWYFGLVFRKFHPIIINSCKYFPKLPPTRSNCFFYFFHTTLICLMFDNLSFLTGLLVSSPKLN